MQTLTVDTFNSEGESRPRFQTGESASQPSKHSHSVMDTSAICLQRKACGQRWQSLNVYFHFSNGSPHFLLVVMVDDDELKGWTIVWREIRGRYGIQIETKNDTKINSNLTLAEHIYIHAHMSYKYLGIIVQKNRGFKLDLDEASQGNWLTQLLVVDWTEKQLIVILGSWVLFSPSAFRCANPMHRCSHPPPPPPPPPSTCRDFLVVCFKASTEDLNQSCSPSAQEVDSASLWLPTSCLVSPPPRERERTKGSCLSNWLLGTSCSKTWK